MLKPLLVSALLVVGLTGGSVADEVAGPVNDTETTNEQTNEPTDGSQIAGEDISASDQEIFDALNNAEFLGTDVEKLVALIGASLNVAGYSEDLRIRLEAVIADWTKPLPASAVEQNIAGYLALAKVRPDNATYTSKLAKYRLILEQQRKDVLSRFNKRIDEFSGVTWYRHKNIPKYTDTRSYIALYIGVEGSGTPFLRFRLNYTNDKWLFIESAEASIDGQRVTLPFTEWQRDNDSEIWEWVDVSASSTLIEIARNIAASKQTIIRFNGQQYYDDYKVKEEDKIAIRDAILAFDVLSNDGEQ